MKRNIILILLLSAIILPLSAQINPSGGQSFSIGIAYFGELITHPGISVFADYLILEKSRMHMSARLNLGYFYHQGNSHNVFIFPEAVITALTDSSLFFDISAGGGWLYQIPSGSFVEYENENFTPKTGSRSYFMPSIALKSGVTFKAAESDLLVAAGGLRGFWQFPYNDQWIIRPAAEIELRYRFNREGAE